jgi:two-component system cell cycle response regulator DivK
MARILLVEDNPLNRELMTDLLEMSGYQVESASDGEEALRLAASAQHDLILLDLTLPGIDGLTVARELNADPVLARVPVVVVSGHACKADEEKALRMGCRGYISKPIEMNDFLARVEAFLKPS